MLLGILITPMVVGISNILVHSLGIYLLCSLLQYGNLGVQQKYLFHLSICEILFNILEIAKHILTIFPLFDNTSDIGENLSAYLTLMSFPGVTMALYLIMAYITIDRLMLTILSVLYPLYWSIAKVKLLLMITWVTCIFTSLCLILIHQYTVFKLNNGLLMYCNPIYDLSFIILALISFLYTCYKREMYTGIKLPRKRRGNMKPKGLIVVFLKSNIDVYIPLMLIFLTVMVIPNLIHVVLRIICNNQSNTLPAAFNICYQLMTLMHGFICIFLYRPTKRLLWRKLNIQSSSCNGDNILMINHLITATSAAIIQV